MKVSQQLPQMNVGARSDTGKVREENQDRMTRTQVPLGDLYIVADGMGGYQGGAQAAQLTIQTVQDYLRLVPSCTPVEEAIARAIEAANTRVHSEANSGNPNTEKMGSTIVLLLVTSELVTNKAAADSSLKRRSYLRIVGQLPRSHFACWRQPRISGSAEPVEASHARSHGCSTDA